MLLKNKQKRNMMLKTKQKRFYSFCFNSFSDFTINTRYDKDGDWMSYLVEVPNVSAFAKTPQKSISQLKIAWKAFKESCSNGSI